MSRLDLITDWTDLVRKANYNSTQLAALCEVSPSQLRPYFLCVFHRPPQDWINELRLWDAMQMLAQGHSVKYVASALNFADAAHFCHRYKKYHGEPPTKHIRLRARSSKNFQRVTGLTDTQEPWTSAERTLLSPLFRKNRDRLN